MQITCAEKCLGMLSLVFQDEDVMNNVHRSPKLMAGVHTRVEDKLNAGPEATGWITKYKLDWMGQSDSKGKSFMNGGKNKVKETRKHR